MKLVILLVILILIPTVNISSATQVSGPSEKLVYSDQLPRQSFMFNYIGAPISQVPWVSVNLSSYLNIAESLLAKYNGSVWFDRISEWHYLLNGDSFNQTAVSNITALVNDIKQLPNFNSKTFLIVMTQFVPYSLSFLKSQVEEFIKMGFNGVYFDGTQWWQNHQSKYESLMQWAVSKYPKDIFIVNGRGIDIGDPIPPTYASNMFISISPENTTAFPLQVFNEVNESGWSNRILVHFISFQKSVIIKVHQCNFLEIITSHNKMLLYLNTETANCL